MYKKYLKLTLTLILVFSFNSVSYAYNYAEAEDPMVHVFKEAVNLARQNSWDKLKLEFEEGVNLQKGHKMKADHLTSVFEKTVSEKDVSGIIELFANLVFLSIDEKLKKNSSERLKDFKESKERLKLARKSYLEVLDGNIEKKDKGSSKKINESFVTALNSLGNPGIFGIGKKDADLSSYDKAIRNIEELVLKAFPNFRLN